MRRSIRVLLADDHVLVRAGLRALLQRVPGVKVVAEASDGYEAVDQARRTHPDLVLMDVTMPKLNGIDATCLVRKEAPGTRVLMLSMHPEEEIVVKALRAGASGYAVKDAGPEELAEAMETVLRGETWIAPSLPRDLIQQHLERPTDGAGALTLRQREILQLLAEGKGTKEIAFCLGISAKTVETHRERLMERLGIHDLAGLVRYAMGHGIVST